MTAADGVLVVIGAGVVAYTVLGGADFGGGVWDLFARNRKQRELIASTMGPVWEANHVWLVFVLIGLFSGFPVAFGQLSRMLTVPLAVALLGIVMRGAAFVFRQYGDDPKSPWGRVFAIASVLAPASLGYCAGSLAVGRVGGWFPVAAAALAVACCAYLAAVFLCREAVTRGEPDLAVDFRRRALGSAVATGVLAVVALPVLDHDAPGLVASLGVAVAVSVVAGVGTIVALLRHRYRTARVFAASAVATVVAGWGLAQYPVLVPPDLTLTEAAAPAQTLPVTLGVLVVGFAVTLPAVALLFRIFSRPAMMRE
ncbi:cytochrome d ubiquinol oxidase subunit II [Virgisporangium ochraceum]|uniref:Cytochrome D ubiquinol oxidase subunit II n=1 Tax=Virgisporangium ochraceum TaxID=65505 RepID=A0A8J4EHH6_9ACTN|nr:cytochrome d ubiquinol oxidase subunit II [Virgisporangium ochraceum]GIJ74994.1 cytochrome D ubiquinol oxidase subunit II [Virgisporangium ochraceum]